jgi:hypothetical protein
MRVRLLGGSLLVAFLALGCPHPAAAHSDLEGRTSYVGVNGHIPSTGDFERLREAGISWVRVDFTWDVVEPKPGQYRWALLDRVVSDAERNGVNVLAILGYTPKWASTGPDRYSPPRDTQEWKTFVGTIVGRYRGRIRHWSLWNEPNSDTFFHGTVDHFIREILIPGANAAKAANPDCRIVGPDLAHLSGSDWDKWLDRICAEAGGHIDVVSHHVYKDKPKDVLRELDGHKKFFEGPTVKEILKKNRMLSKPFWLTETGWRTTEVGEDGQAGHLISLLKGTSRKAWIYKVFIFEWRDSPQLPGYGLLRGDDSPKPSFTAVKGYAAYLRARKRN